MIKHAVRKVNPVKNFKQLRGRFKEFTDYETNNECQLCNFSWESVLGKTFNFIT